MPIYEYRCEKCGHEFEVWQKMNESGPKTCPKCHGKKISRLISNTSFQLKGSGWYATDYGRGSGATPSKKKDEPSSVEKPSEPAAKPADKPSDKPADKPAA